MIQDWVKSTKRGLTLSIMIIENEDTHILASTDHNHEAMKEKKIFPVSKIGDRHTISMAIGEHHAY